MTRIGKRVVHLYDPAGIGTIVEQRECVVIVQMDKPVYGRHDHRYLVNRVADERIAELEAAPPFVERASFTYRPGDRDALQGADAAPSP